MSFDVEWETFCNMSERPLPERNVTGANEAIATMNHDHDSARK